MAADILKLKKSAVAAGMDKNEARKATRAQLEAFLAKPKAPAKKSSGAPAKKKAAVKTPARTTATKKAPVRKATKTTPARKSATAKAPATSKTAKRPATKTTSNTAAGRNLLGTLDFSKTEGWNPRAGSAVERIFRALKKYRGNVDKAFDALVGDIGDFVGAKKQDGTKRTKADREAMLRYRISRTKFDFAVSTGQHEIATERAEYGTGAYATTRAKKPARKTNPNKRSAPRTTTTAKAATRKVNTRSTAKKTARKR